MPRMIKEGRAAKIPGDAISALSLQRTVSALLYYRRTCVTAEWDHCSHEGLGLKTNKPPNATYMNDCPCFSIQKWIMSAGLV